MRSIDIHAHLTPQCFIRAMQAGKAWHGIQPGTMRIAPRAIWTPEQRLADMNSLGVDVHVVSTGAAFYYYDKDATTVAAMSSRWIRLSSTVFIAAYSRKSPPSCTISSG